MRKIKLVLIAIASLYLYGCASGATFEAMVYSGEKKQYDANLQSALSVGSVTGGKKTNPAWTSEISSEAFAEALKGSLINQGLFSESGQYQLSAEMLKVEQPMFGLDLTVTTHIQYVLTDTASGKILLDETIVTPHTATMSQAFAAVKRLRLANEGSGMANIEGILTKLSEINIGQVRVTMLARN